MVAIKDNNNKRRRRRAGGGTGNEGEREGNRKKTGKKTAIAAANIFIKNLKKHLICFVMVNLLSDKPVR